MLHCQQVEELITLVSSLDREGIVEQFGNYRASFPLDFTPDFLNSQPLERLQHIFVALCLQCQRMPDIPASEAA